jgi:raffinose/stachyose/melibiose transport system permease protein
MAQHSPSLGLKRGNMRKKWLRDNISAYTFLLPTLILFCVFTVYPFINAFVISMCKWDGLTQMQFVGLDNFRRLFNDKKVFTFLGHNLEFGFWTVLFKTVLGFVIALFLKERFKGTAFFRATFFMPVMMSFVAIGMLWQYIYNPASGLLNSIGISLGLYTNLTAPTWLGDASTALKCVAVVDIWRWTGYHMVIFMAGLQTIPNDIYEAAIVDGANERQQLWYITIPQMRGITLTNMIFCMTGAISVFDLIFTMTGGGPYNSTKTIALYVYEQAFSTTSRFGYATAINVFLFFIILIITSFMMKLMDIAEKSTH